MSLYTIAPFQQNFSISGVSGLQIRESADSSLLSALGGTTEKDVVNRLANDHLAFVAYLEEKPAAFGWMARGSATIGELNHRFILPTRQRYLWNFRTLPDFRGRGIYPLLLQFMMQSEARRAERFWIIHAPENKASLKGIQKAGFEFVGNLYTGASGQAVIAHTRAAEQYRHDLAYMDIELSPATAASCWNCSSPYLKKRIPTCCCATAGEECTSLAMLNRAS